MESKSSFGCFFICKFCKLRFAFSKDLLGHERNVHSEDLQQEDLGQLKQQYADTENQLQIIHTPISIENAEISIQGASSAGATDEKDRNSPETVESRNYEKGKPDGEYEVIWIDSSDTESESHLGNPSSQDSTEVKLDETAKPGTAPALELNDPSLSPTPAQDASVKSNSTYSKERRKNNFNRGVSIFRRGKYKCRFCPKVFRSISSKSIHDKTCLTRPPPPPPAEVTTNSASSILAAKRKRKADKFNPGVSIFKSGKYKCRFCPKVFRRISSKSIHEKTCLTRPPPPAEVTTNSPSSFLAAKRKRKADKFNRGVSIFKSGRKIFKCRFCPKLLRGVNGRTLHERIHTCPFKCPQCTIGFPSKALFNIHINQVHRIRATGLDGGTQQNLRCLEHSCTFLGSSKHFLRDHQLKVHSTVLLETVPKFPRQCQRRITSETVGKNVNPDKSKYPQKSSRLKHPSSSNESKHPPCSTHLLERKSVAYNHFLSKTYYVPCSICKKMISGRRIPPHRKLHHPDVKPFQCFDCPYETTSAASLQQHRKHCRNENQEKCLYCNASYKTRTGCEKHMQKEHVRSDYELTGAANVEERGKKMPEKVRRKEKCKFCEKVFSYPAAKEKHENTHIMLPFRCVRCNRQFTENGALQTHRCCVKIKRRPLSCVSVPNVKSIDFGDEQRQSVQQEHQNCKSDTVGSPPQLRQCQYGPKSQYDVSEKWPKEKIPDSLYERQILGENHSVEHFLGRHGGVRVKNKNYKEAVASWLMTHTVKTHRKLPRDADCPDPLAGVKLDSRELPIRSNHGNGHSLKVFMCNVCHGEFSVMDDLRSHFEFDCSERSENTEQEDESRQMRTVELPPDIIGPLRNGNGKNAEEEVSLLPPLLPVIKPPCFLCGMTFEFPSQLQTHFQEAHCHPSS